MHIGRSEFVLLSGESASGKSTAMQAVCGFIPHIVPAQVSGEVLFEGRRLEDPADIAKVVGMVQQDPETQFCTETVWEEVAFGPENFRFPVSKVAEAVDRALASVNALGLRDRKLSTLSGGEQQKVAIASLLSLSPKMLILDEPTSSLDPKSVREVIGAIETLRRETDVTVVVAEHRLGGFLGMATRALVMSEGKIVADTRRGEPAFSELAASATKPLGFARVDRKPAFVVRVEGLSYSVGGKKILDDVSFSVPEGAAMAIVGENGAGKTTLLRHLVGLTPVQSGSIKVFDHLMTPSAKVDPWTLGKDIGIVFQNPNHQIFESSVEKEVRFASTNYGCADVEGERAIQSFERAEGLSRNAHPLCLSHGQKRRINILSSSSHGPRLLLLDEPFIGQDRKNMAKIAEMILGIQRSGRTVIAVTHDIDFALSVCTDVLLMRDGKIVAAGDSSGPAGKAVADSMEAEK